MKWKDVEWEVVENPDPATEAWATAWLNYMSALDRIASTYAFYIGPAQAD